MNLSTFLALKNPVLNFLNFLKSRALLLINHFLINKRVVILLTDFLKCHFCLVNYVELLSKYHSTNFAVKIYTNNIESFSEFRKPILLSGF